MQKDWMKSSVIYTFTDKDHKKGVRHSFPNVVKDVTAETVKQFGEIIDSLTEGTLTNATVSNTEQVKLENKEAAAAPEQPAEPAKA